MTKRCVLGHDIGYSLSPCLHAAIGACLGEQSSYTVEDIPPEKLQDALPRLIREYDGFNVTKPYKERVAKFLGCKHPVNTVRCRDGACTSTDPIGFLSDYTAAFGRPQGKMLLLGAGGAAKSVAEALHAVNGTEVFVYNRTFERAKALEMYKVTAVDSPRGKYDAVINATSAGLHGELAGEGVDFEGVRYAYDLVYAPPVTPFMQKAAQAGAATKNGLGMLVYQAIAAHEFWRGKSFGTEEKMRLYDAAMQALAARK